MKTKEIEKKVKLILSDKLDVPLHEIKNITILRDELGLDSFGIIEISFALEEAFNISLLKQNDNPPAIETLKDLVDFLKLKICGTNSGD